MADTDPFTPSAAPPAARSPWATAIFAKTDVATRFLDEVGELEDGGVIEADASSRRIVVDHRDGKHETLMVEVNHGKTLHENHCTRTRESFRDALQKTSPAMHRRCLVPQR